MANISPPPSFPSGARYRSTPVGHGLKVSNVKKYMHKDKDKTVYRLLYRVTEFLRGCVTVPFVELCEG